ncbi:MAG: inorganic phosphate transporter [Vampirovibrionia bacterium]
MGMELYIILILAIIVGFYMAWNIGANDVANAMGTCVGSGSISLKQAIIIAGIFEFLGAVLVGSHVTQTIKGSIISPEQFINNPDIFMWGMFSAMLASGILLQIATYYSLPVSTTHAIIGGVAGFGIVSVGIANINWDTLSGIALSWVISPVAGAITAFTMFLVIKRKILFAENPMEQMKSLAPYLVMLIAFVLVHSLVYKGLKNLHLDLNFTQASIIAGIIGIISAIICNIWINKKKLNIKEDQIDFVERIFGSLLIITGCYITFAHGANDVANAIGPLAAITTVVQNQSIDLNEMYVPLWVLMLGGIGIVIGLATWGYRVMETLGKKITELTPTRGFSATFGAATTVLICSKLGLPVSTTHVIVGSVIGVALARGIGALNTAIIKDIFASWIVTIPASAIFTMIIFKVIEFIAI